MSLDEWIICKESNLFTFRVLDSIQGFNYKKSRKIFAILKDTTFFV